MKIALIGQGFNKNSGQGVYEYSNYLYENLSEKGIKRAKEFNWSDCIKNLLRFIEWSYNENI